ncbi:MULTISPECIES: Lnb N-terminal periplasmic domain-containing protein [unclassified Luteimonas]
MRIAASCVLSLLIAAATVWGGLLLHFHGPGSAPLRMLPVVAWCLLGTAACLAPAWHALRVRQRPLLVSFVAGFAALLAWWFTLSPSHDREWADDVARLLDAEVRDNRVVLRNVRNFEWRSETDYTQRWETREYDLDRLATADLVLSYWMGPHIAHTLVSFGFEDGSQVVFSAEIRKERQESFSALAGFFRNYEQVLVAADERDIIRTRSNARGEDVFLYRLDAPPEALRGMFLGFVDSANALRLRPAFYNSLTGNCTTVIFDIARHVAPGLPMDYRLLLSGHFAEYAHDQGGLTAGYSFDELQERGYINPRALAVPADDPDAAAFSRAIRRQVPGVPAPGTAP